MNDGLKLMATLANDSAQGVYEKLAFTTGEDEIGCWAAAIGEVDDQDLILMADFVLRYKEAPAEALYRYVAGDLERFDDVGGFAALEMPRLKAFRIFRATTIELDAELEDIDFEALQRGGVDDLVSSDLASSDLAIAQANEQAEAEKLAAEKKAVIEKEEADEAEAARVVAEENAAAAKAAAEKSAKKPPAKKQPPKKS